MTFLPTQHPRKNEIFPGRDFLRPQPALDRVGPYFFLCTQLESCHDGARSPGRHRRQIAHARPLATLKFGTEVRRIHDEKSKLWKKSRVIISIRKFISYHVKFASGSVLWRNQRFLHPIRTAYAPLQPTPEEVCLRRLATRKPTEPLRIRFPPRRSHRERKTPNRHDL